MTLDDCIKLDEAIVKAEGLMTEDELIDSYHNPAEDEWQKWEQAQERRFAEWLAFSWRQGWGLARS